MFKFLLLFYICFFTINVSALSINETIKSTIENNPKIKIGYEKLNEKKELITNASGALLPDIESKISGTYESSNKKTSSTTTENDTFSDSYKITITQSLYDAGYDQLEIERSKILYANEILNFKILIQDLILDAIIGYLTVLNYETSLEANKKNYEFVASILEETKIKYNADAATLYDLKIAESSYEIAKANVFASEQNLLIGKKTFKRIVALDAINLENQVQIDKNISFEDIKNNSLNNNLSLKILENDIKNKEILLLKEKKTKKPNLNLTGTTEYSDSDRIDDGTETLKGNIAITLTIPIFQQGIDESNIRKYYSQILQSELNLEDSTDDLIINISNNYKDLKINEAKMRANIATIESNKTALKILNEEYAIGTKTISDLIDEEEKLLENNLNFSNSKKDYFVSYFKIKLLEGTLLDNFSQYLPEIK